MAGIYAADGSINVTQVSGAAYVGRYAPDGSMNVFISSGTSPVGKTHASGAQQIVRNLSGTQHYHHGDGSTLIQTTPYTLGGQRITIVSGSIP